MSAMSITRGALRGGLSGLVVAAATATGAVMSGAWAVDVSHSEVKLLQGEFADGAWTAGVQIDLAEGWKTYWRMPGEAGIAPQFDWSKSRNVADVELSWPAPARYHDASGETIGYANRVVFPVSVHPVDGSKPVNLALTLDYAVCRDICVPARVELEEQLEPGPAMSSASAALIRQFEDRVPQRAAPGVELEGARLGTADGAYHLAVELTGEAVDSSTDIFVESFDDAYFRAARRSGNANVFHLPVDGLADPDTLRGRTLRLTVVTATAELVGDVTVE